jgi:hypothetical protein
MGANIRPHELADLAEWDADLKITCRRCKRTAVFDLLPILNHFRAHGWNTSWSCVASRFVCKGTADQPGCGSKDLAAGLAPRVMPAPPEPRMTETQMRQRAKRERH